MSEIYDADAPHHPRGCVAQARGVAEVLRVVKEYVLYDVKVVKTKKKLRRSVNAIGSYFVCPGVFAKTPGRTEIICGVAGISV